MEYSVESTPAADGAARRPIVDIAVAVAGGVILKLVDPLIPTQWGPWPQRITTALAVLAALYALYVGWRWIAPRARNRARERRIEAELREPLLRLCTELSEATTQSFVRGVASVLHSLTEAKVIDARSHNQCVAHVSTLWSSADWIAKDVGQHRLSAWEGVRRLITMQGDYVRVCCALSDAASAANLPHVQRQWDEIREHANSISHKLTELEQVAQIRRGLSGARTYIQTVPRAY